MRPRVLCLLLWWLVGLLLAGCTVLDREESRQRGTQEMNATIEIANPVLDAIEAYEADYGWYPGRLEVLLPRYLSRIPTTSSGREFRYERDDLYGEWYHLCFDLATYPNRGCCYFPRLGLWDCSPGCE